MTANLPFRGSKSASPFTWRELRYVFIVCYARSGSTVLQKALNTSKGVLIRGENAGIALKLISISRYANSAKAKFHGDYNSTDSPWFGFSDFNPSLLAEDFRRVVTERLLRPGTNTRVAGFKEVRWNFDDLKADLDEMKRVFPGAKFVFNVRNPERTSLSGPWKQNPESLTYLTRADLSIRNVAKEIGEDGILIEYEDWASRPVRIANVLEFLQQGYDLEEIRKVVNTHLDHAGI